MRKSLFFAAALSLSLSVSAQTQLTEVVSMNVHKNEVLTKKMTSAQLDAKKFTGEQMREAFKTRAANPATGFYFSYLPSANFDDLAVLSDVTITGDEVSIDGLLPFEGVAPLKGTLKNGVLTIPTTTVMEDGFGPGVDLMFGTINASNAQPNASMAVAYDEESGSFSYQDENNILMLYAAENGAFAGYYMWFNGLTMNPYNAFIPYYTTEDVWYAGLTNDMYLLQVLTGGVASSAGTVDYTSWVSFLNSDYNYELNWSYGNATYTGDKLQMPTNSADLNFPTVIASFEGQEVSGYRLTDGESQIFVDASSEMEGSDYGWTTYNAWGGLVLPATLSGEYAYGSGKTTAGKEETVYTDLVLYYPNKNAEFSFSSIDVLGVSSDMVGNLTATVIKATKGQQGFPELLDENPIAQSRTVSVADMNVQGSVAITSQKEAQYGMLSFNQFVAQDEDGFEVELDKITVDGSFVVIISGLKDADFGLFMDGVADLSKMILFDSENVFLQTENGYIKRTAFYRNPALFFRGAGWGEGSSISSVENAEDGIVAVANGASFELSYPEAVNAVQVVNVAGQVVAEYSLDGTSATISAAGLTNGMYILKFNNGAAVKVMK